MPFTVTFVAGVEAAAVGAEEQAVLELDEEAQGELLVTHEPEIAACASRQLLVRDGKITRDEGKGVVMDVV